MANITELPAWVKAMTSLFGEKWGKILGRAFVILVLVTLVAVIITTLFGRLPISVLYWILGVILALVAMVGVPMALGIFLGMILRVSLTASILGKIDNALNRLLPILQEVNKDKLDKEAINKLWEDAEKLETQWNESIIVRFIHWWNKPRYIKR